ncbi:MAG: hypothetical protein ACD_39C01497G0002 [uncultured bacterium]|nr:MAG: hypothetical protein ACD_39C01497G0002 [uncultured bacterium]
MKPLKRPNSAENPTLALFQFLNSYATGHQNPTMHRARQALCKITRNISSLGTLKKQTILHSGSEPRSRIRITVNPKVRFAPRQEWLTDHLSAANLSHNFEKSDCLPSVRFRFALNLSRTSMHSVNQSFTADTHTAQSVYGMRFDACCALCAAPGR